MGKQVYIDEKYHRRLKRVSVTLDKPMKKILEETIEQMEVENNELNTHEMEFDVCIESSIQN
jgi:hypothetical protein